MCEQEADIIPLPIVITADQALSVADISPGISEKMNKGMFGWRRRERELLKTTQWLMLKGGLSGVPSISCFKESTQVSPELKVSSGVSTPLSLCHGSSQKESFHNKWRSQVHLKKALYMQCAVEKLLNIFPGCQKLKYIKEKTLALLPPKHRLGCWKLGLE